ncbi:DUF1572 family protein [Pseudofulvibacter geojedonensis]|uniref:DUF1572 family protein n=1 Tax=Pseudofulvibacter geojedonensis TaxID=1123758 RepID=A0ABW3HYQ9_9FLAO
MNTYLSSIQKQFNYYKSLGEKTFSQLTDEQLFWQPNEVNNSIAIIVKHISGNMLSRWTNFLTEDGEKEWRDRDDEFEGTITTREELLVVWNRGWSCLFEAINPLEVTDLEKEIFIRNMGHSVTEAINRQLAHYSYHIGQIVLIGKLAVNQDWQSLSIPKGGSKIYNADKFSKPKRTEHFTDDL